MSDNTSVKNASAATVSVSTDELSDSSQSPKVTLLDGTGSPVGISPATDTTLLTIIKTEDAAAVSGDKGIVALGVRRDTAASSSTTDGDYSTFNFDATGHLYTTGTFSGTVTIAAGATSIAKAEDVGSADADVGVPAMAVRKASPANTSGSDGDYEFLQISAGRLWASATIDAALPAGSATIGAVTNTPLTNFGAGEYETVAASQTAQALGATGATGDYIQGVLVIPATTTPGVVTLLDNAISIPLFVGGASSVSNLVPFFIPLGMISVSGAWKLTTGANVSCIGIGNFT